MDTINEYNKALEYAIFVLNQRAERLGEDSNKLAGLETAIAMLKGLLK